MKEHSILSKTFSRFIFQITLALLPLILVKCKVYSQIIMSFSEALLLESQLAYNVDEVCQKKLHSISSNLDDDLVFGIAEPNRSNIFQTNNIRAFWYEADISSSVVIEKKVSINKLITDVPKMSQYFWYISGWIPLGQGALVGLKKKTILLISQ